MTNSLTQGDWRGVGVAAPLQWLRAPRDDAGHRGSVAFLAPRGYAPVNIAG
jgi:hypothetical protein